MPGSRNDSSPASRSREIANVGSALLPVSVIPSMNLRWAKK